MPGNSSFRSWPSLRVTDTEGASTVSLRVRWTEADVALVYMKFMQIEVVGKDESSNSQARTYAEYRFSATLARHRQRIRGVRIVLRRGKRNGACDTVVCAVTVALNSSGTVRAQVREGHAYAAINRTVERIGYLMRDTSYCP
jgi:ribosome-associated translation inhibitor RaiA